MLFEDDSGPNHPAEYLRRSIRVGSIKTPLNYTMKQEAVRPHEVLPSKIERSLHILIDK
jgi:hypothetical protein